MNVENNYKTLTDLKKQFSIAESIFPFEVFRKVHSVLYRLELHEKSQIKISQTLNEYSTNSKKIYIHLVRISNLWAIYEGLFDTLENFLESDIFLKKNGKGKLVNGYLETFSSKVVISYSKSIKLPNFFEFILEKSSEFPHKDGLSFINEIKEYLTYLINENIRVKQKSNNEVINQIIEKFDTVYNIKVHNYRKKTNIKILGSNEKVLKWVELLTLIYSIRNHFYHNSHVGTESIATSKSEKFRLIFLLGIYEMFSEVLKNILWNEINKYSISKNGFVT